MHSLRWLRMFCMRTTAVEGTLSHPQMGYTYFAIAPLKFLGQNPPFICTQSGTGWHILSLLPSALAAGARSTCTAPYRCQGENQDCAWWRIMISIGVRKAFAFSKLQLDEWMNYIVPAHLQYNHLESHSNWWQKGSQFEVFVESDIPLIMTLLVFPKGIAFGCMNKNKYLLERKRDNLHPSPPWVFPLTPELKWTTWQVWPLNKCDHM